MVKLRVKSLMLAALLCGLVGCGEITLGGDGGTSEVPDGTLVAQSEFAEAGTVDGIASIYSQGGGNYTLRLSSLTAASSAYSVRVNALSGVVLTATLGITSGSKNYSFDAAEGESFISVEVYQGATVHGTAIF